MYQRVKQHLATLIDNPLLVIGEDAHASSGALFGSQSWDSPELMRRVGELRQANQLPNLEALFVAFCKGALKTMERHTKEYAPQGVIAQLTPRRQKRGFASLTNDENESALAETSEYKRRNPTMSDSERNALFQAKKNQLEDWQEHVLEPSPLAADAHKYVIQAAREEEKEKREQRARGAHVNGFETRIVENNEAADKKRKLQDQRAEKLKKIELLDLDIKRRALAALNVTDLDAQITKLRSVDVDLIKPKSTFVGSVDGVKPKARRIEAILVAFKELKRRREEVAAEDLSGEEVEEGVEEEDDRDMRFEDELQ
jgi:hypothetical protein